MDQVLCHGSISNRHLKRYNHLPWLYLGRSYKKSQTLNQILNPQKKIYYKSDLTKISYDLRDAYTEFMIELGRPYWDQFEWWITGLATRDSGMSDLFLHLCYLEVIKKIHQENKSILIICESWCVFDTIHQNFPVKTIRVLHHKYLNYMHFFQDIKTFIKSWISYLCYTMIKLTIAKASSFGHPTKDHILQSKTHTVIHTCINERCLNNNVFYDRYYPEIAEYLTQNGKKISRFLWFHSISVKKLYKLIKGYRNHPDSFLIPYDYYGIIDAIKSCFITIKSSYFHFNNPRFNGVNIQSLLNYEQKIQRKNSGIAYFLNQMAIIKNWKKKKYNIAMYIDTWEQKCVEVPAIVALNTYFPGCKTVAYQHGALLSKLRFANYKTSIAEFRAAPTPNILIANSRLTKKILAEEGFPKDKIKVGPSLRYLYLDKVKSFPEFRKKKNIVICLPLPNETSVEILTKCYSVLRNAIEYNIIIKPHPQSNLNVIQSYLTFDLKDYGSINNDGSLQNVSTEVDIMITSVSSSMVESVYNNIPTIVIDEDTNINIMPLDFIEDNLPYTLVNQTEELRQALNDLAKYDINKYRTDNTRDWFNFNISDLSFLLE